MFRSPPHPHKALTLAAVCLGTFMLLIDLTIVVVALPAIRGAFHTSFSDIQWTIDAYSLSLAALLLPTGSLADIVGRRRVFIGGLSVFTLGSLLCGVSGSGIELVVFRALQGIGGATIFATSLALLAQTFHGRDRGMAFGIWGAVVTLAGALGPVLGGLLTTELSWRWIFLVNLPLGVVAILITLVGVKEFRPPDARRIDVPGASVFTFGLLALVYGLIESSRSGWGSARVLVSLALAVAALTAFPLIESARREPMFDLQLLRKPTFVGGLLAAFGMNASLYAMLLYLVIYLQSALHESALGAGARLALITAGAMITAIPSGRLSEHVPVRWLIAPGLALVGIGLLLMRGITASATWTHLILGFAIAGAGSGMVNPPLAATAVGVVAPQDAGMASGINTTFRQIGIATAVAAFGSIFASRMSGATPATLTAHYASALNTLLLAAAIIAITAGLFAAALIRRRDLHPSTARTRAAPTTWPSSKGSPPTCSSSPAPGPERPPRRAEGTRGLHASEKTHR
jgi:EmrB/QacA subfamily drug resistance transporter